MTFFTFVQNENELNETIRCECFGFGLYEGEKCQTKSTKLIVIQTTIKTTSYIAIMSIILFYLMVFLSDIHNVLTKSNKNKSSSKQIKRKSLKKKTIATKLVYTP